MDGLTERVPLPEHVERRLNVWRGAGALVLLALWAWHAFVRDTEVPVLVFLDIAVHEIGHVLFRPFGELTMLVMGSGLEVGFALVVGLVGRPRAVARGARGGAGGHVVAPPAGRRCRATVPRAGLGAAGHDPSDRPQPDVALTSLRVAGTTRKAVSG